MRIGFFDSGLGGLTVLAEALRRLPAKDYLYMADTLNVPYGTKTKDDVRRFVLDAVGTMVGHGIDALVVACNTATSIAINELREIYSMPIVGMEPAVKPAVEMNQATGKRVLVCATPLTLSMPKYYALVSRVDENGIVDSLPLPELVDYCERLVFDGEEIEEFFRRKLEPFDLDRYGIVVLGCTHFIYFREALRRVLPESIGIVDGNAGTVRRLAALMTRYGISASDGCGDVKFMSTGGDPSYIRKMEIALDRARSL
jgi:glutamate racemase